MRALRAHWGAGRTQDNPRSPTIMNALVSLAKTANVAVIRVDNPPVNALSHAVRLGIAECLATAIEDQAVQAIVLLCAGRTFMAGADITEFDKPPQAPGLRDVLAQFDASPKLTIAAIHGTAFGGGFETALGCHYRIGIDSAQVGLPESKLGVLPGAGGTQRLPRLVGAEQGLDMMVSGDPISAGAALSSGAVDRVVTDNLEQAALEYAAELLETAAPLRITSELPGPTVADGFFDDYAKAMARRTRGFEAPARILKCVSAACNLDFQTGLAIEHKLFQECMASTQSAAMRYLFFADRAVAKIPGIGRDTPQRSIHSVGIVGSGTMGTGIALACMNANLPVVMLDTNADALARGRATIENWLATQVSKGRLTAEISAARLELLTISEDYADFNNVDLAIEAVFETMAIKEAVFQSLDTHCKPGAILATNTSSLDVDRIANATVRPEDVIGLHFFSPAHIMRLLEIVRGTATSKELIASSLSFAKTIGKTGAVVGNCFGFVGNRMLRGYARENQLLLLEGAEPFAIDQVLQDWGMAMGPNAVGDLAGLDVGYRVRQAQTNPPKDPRYFRVFDKLAEAGHFGQKTSRGVFLYEPGSRTPIPDPDVHALIETEAAALGVERRDISSGEIVERCIYALVIEGCRILEDGIALKASDIDVIWTSGYGFPRYRGGPMKYADLIGLDKVYGRILEFQQADTYGYWQLPALLTQLVESGTPLAAYQSK
jgi:3-hydroxyacyl-CoA dehydrogenase